VFLEVPFLLLAFSFCVVWCMGGVVVSCSFGRLILNVFLSRSCVSWERSHLRQGSLVGGAFGSVVVVVAVGWVVVGFGDSKVRPLVSDSPL